MKKLQDLELYAVVGGNYKVDEADEKFFNSIKEDLKKK